MKRSEINRIIRQAQAFLDEWKFALPPFAAWTPEDWRRQGPECAEIVDHQLGWDITDFGSGDFERVGLFLFTLRNGQASSLETGRGKTYAEKIMVCGENQVTPCHTHAVKSEDIIVRGGGQLVVKLWHGDLARNLDDQPVTVSLDGVQRTFPSGHEVVLGAGESITLVPGVYHEFWGKPGGGQVLIGEVSMVNDDRTDNLFKDPVGRFPEIDEDEPPLHLLTADYERYYRP